MKRIHTLTTIVLLLTALSFYLQAQERPLLTATVPFAFGVANINLPAGSYTVSILPPYNMIQDDYGDPPILKRAVSILLASAFGEKPTRLEADRLLAASEGPIAETMSAVYLS